MTGRLLALGAAVVALGLGASFAVGKATAPGEDKAAPAAVPVAIGVPANRPSGALAAVDRAPAMRHARKAKKKKPKKTSSSSTSTPAVSTPVTSNPVTSNPTTSDPTPTPPVSKTPPVSQKRQTQKDPSGPIGGGSG